MKQKYLSRGWKNALQNTDWNWQEKRRRYWNSGGLPGTTEKQEEREIKEKERDISIQSKYTK